MRFIRTLLPAALFVLAAPLVQAIEIDNGFIKENAYETEHYRIEFSDLVMEQEDANNNGLADLIDTVAEAAEYSRALLLDDLGYKDPMAADEKLLIVLDDTDQYLMEGALGVTSLLSNGDPYVAIDPWLTDEYLQITIGHELFHTVQFGYGSDFAYTYTGVNWAEATATWVEDLAYDSNNDYVNYLSDFFDYPDYSVFASIVPSGTLFEYGLNIWPRFLSEYYDEDVIKEIWEAYFDSDLSYSSDLRLYSTVDAVVTEHGDELKDVFRYFTLWNLDLSDYEEGSSYPNVLLLDGETAEEYQGIDSVYAPALFGTNYIYFENAGRDNSFYFHIQKPAGVRFAVTLVPYDSGEVDLVRSTFTFVEPDELMNEALELPSLSSKDGVIAVISPLDANFSSSNATSNFDEAYLYNFLAEFGPSNEDFSSTIETGSTDQTSVDSTKEGEVASGDKGVSLPNQLMLSVVTYDEDSVTFKWNRLVDEPIASYELRYGIEEEALDQVKTVVQAHTTFATVSGLEEGTTVYFKLVGLDSEGEELDFSSSIFSVTPQEWIFSDVSYLNDYYAAIAALTDEGVFSGYPDGSFLPDATINRAELLKILIEAKEGMPSAQFKNCFSDVGIEWFARYVCYAKDQAWIQGDGDGSFRPGDAVNKVEALKMLFNVYGENLVEGEAVSDLPYSDLNLNAWYSVYVERASELGILEETPDVDFEAGAGRSRAEMALELYRYLIINDLINE